MQYLSDNKLVHLSLITKHKAVRLMAKEEIARRLAGGARLQFNMWVVCGNDSQH